MIIHDKRQDYYDGVQRMGRDNSLHYVRTESSTVLGGTDWEGNWADHYVPRFHSPVGKYRVSAGVVGFCGSYFPFICAEKIADYNNEVKYFYDFDEYRIWKDKERDPEPKWRSYSRTPSHSWKMFEHYKGKQSDNLFLQLNSPILILEREKVNIVCKSNVILKDYGFFIIKDAWTAFQEISMYLGNQLVQTKPILEIEDKYRIQSHGFDKDSFRNPIKFKDLK